MRSKSGFTLIELLAVIVILAVIALIATPIIMNVINDSKKGAAKDAMYGYVKAVELASAKMVTPTIDALSGDNFVTVDGNIYEGSSKKLDVSVKGTKPKDNTGVVKITKGTVTYAELEFDGVLVTYDGKTAEVGSDGSANQSNFTLVSGTALTVGAKYKYASASEESTWYVIASDTNSVTLLSEYNLAKTNNFKTQDKTEYTFTDNIDSELWMSKNAIAFDGITNRNNDNNTYCNRISETHNKYMGCNMYQATSGTVTNGSISGTVTTDSTIKPYVDQYVASLKLGSNLLEGRLITKDELVQLGCSEAQMLCPTDQYPWLTSISYWAGTPSNENNYEVWAIISLAGEYSFSTVDTWASSDDVWGIRPVIKLKKTAF